MVKFGTNKVVFNYILSCLVMQSFSHGAFEKTQHKLRFRYNLFCSKFDLLKENIREYITEKTSENVADMSPSEKCEMKDIISEEFEKGEGIPKIEEIVKKLGYPIEKYTIETEDGYLLTLFRIKHGKKVPDVTIGRPVMLQHGLLDSAAVFLATPTGIAYYLADKGYDVWIGNSRGTIFSRDHTDKDRSPDKEGTTFWEYSFHEMGVYDLPAVFGKIREDPGGQRVHYVGMSMGCTQFLVMATEVDSAQDWVASVVLMAPVARPKHMDMASGVKFLFSWTYFNTFHAVTKGEACIHRAKLSEAVYKFCISNRKKICKSIMNNISKPRAGDNQYDFENTVTSYLYSPAGTSVMTYVHYLQIVTAGKFQRFDYGKTENKVLYKSKKPPEYDLNKIKKHLILMVGGSDDVADEVDVHWLDRKLPSSEIIRDQFKLFTHRDFHHSVNIEDVLYNTILGKFAKWESEEKDHSGEILK